MTKRKATKTRPKKIREVLKQKLTPSQLAASRAGVDIIGDIAIIEVPEELKKKKKTIAKATMQLNNQITTVLEKKSAMEGRYRVRKLGFIAGKRKTKTIYKENGCEFELDLAKVYFSPRLGFERKRIADQVQPGERILALFAGVGPYAIVIARQLKMKKQNCEIAAIELNPIAVKYMEKNIARNKVEGMVHAIKGDVKKILAEKYEGWADRATMPLPHTASDFLDATIRSMKKGGIVHYYGFGENRDRETKQERDPFEQNIKLIKEASKRTGRKCEIIFKRVARPYAPYVVQVAIDFKVVE